jgi:nucleoside-diphosphate-sugar epimerase
MSGATAPAGVRRVLLTGATGFIGSHCIEPLRRRGYEIVATCNTRVPRPIDGVRWVQADLLDAGALAPLLAEAAATHLLHLAWYVEPGKMIAHPDNLAWSRASIELMRRFREGGGERCVIGGSCYEYDWRYGYCNEQLTPRQPDTLYGAAKHGLAETLLGYCGASGLSGAWGRMFFLYGPNENPRRLVPSVILSLLKGEPALSSHGQQVRDYMHVADVAEGMVALLDSPARGAYNIASGRATTIVSIVEALGELTGRADLLRIGAIAARANDAPLVVGDPAAAKRDFGWEASISLRDGLRTAVDWWRSELNRLTDNQS